MALLSKPSDELPGLKRVIKLLEKKLAAAGQPDPSVVVGYTQNYALYVHENLEISLSAKNMKAGRGAKYLEIPYRRLKNQLLKIVKDALRKKIPLSKALLKAGIYLQRESMKMVPIDTGALRASAFTKLE